MKHLIGSRGEFTVHRVEEAGAVWFEVLGPGGVLIGSDASEAAAYELIPGHAADDASREMTDASPGGSD